MFLKVGHQRCFSGHNPLHNQIWEQREKLRQSCCSVIGLSRTPGLHRMLHSFNINPNTQEMWATCVTSKNEIWATWNLEPKWIIHSLAVGIDLASLPGVCNRERQWSKFTWFLRTFDFYETDARLSFRNTTTDHEIWATWNLEPKRIIQSGW